MVETFAKNIDKRFFGIRWDSRSRRLCWSPAFLSLQVRRQTKRPVSGASTPPTRCRSSLSTSRSLTTILVLIMMIDYAPVVRQSIPGATAQAGLGEFFALPIFTCAGLM